MPHIDATVGAYACCAGVEAPASREPPRGTFVRTSFASSREQSSRGYAMRLTRRLSALFVFGLVSGCSGAADTGDGAGTDAAVDTGSVIDSGAPDSADAASPDTAVDSGDDGAPDGMTAQACTIDEDCTAPDFCTNARKCVGGKCAVVGGVPACDDGVPCTTDSCDPSKGACTHTVDDAQCSNGKFCDPKLGCSDILPCTGLTDTICQRLDDDACKGTFECNPTTLRCERAPAPTCKGPDACTPILCVGTKTTYDCQAGLSPDYTKDVNNCGGCMLPCQTRPNSNATCALANCSWTCSLGFFDLNADLNVARASPSDGCECQKTSSVDRPDVEMVDSNCDGIDGDVTKAIFVSPSGNDALGDGSMQKPVLTLSRAITLASAAGKDVYADKGIYAVTTLALKGGVSVFGGYDSTKKWSRAIGNDTRINGGATALVGNGLTADVELQLLHVVAADATVAGTSSYGLVLSNSPSATVVVVGCTIEAGAGAAGLDAAIATKGANGGTGSGRTGGASACGAGGGDGGAAVSGGTPGNKGNDGSTATALGSGAGGPGGPGGGQGKCHSTTYPTDGISGTGGSAGIPGTDAPTVSSSLGNFLAGTYQGVSGIAGTAGSAGGGGGGGGSGGGDSTSCGTLGLSCCDYTSGAGGGGGAGGCGGSAGAGGGAGGGSFAIAALGTHVYVDKSLLTAGAAGRGGNAAAGGAGGNPGGYGAGAGGGGSAKAGGNGGPGAAGAPGGAGAGGAGGPSICVAYAGGSVYQPAVTNSPCSRAAAVKGGNGGVGSNSGPAGVTADLQSF